MTGPNSSTTIPNYVAGSRWDNTDIGHTINLLFLRADRAEQQWRHHELMRSRRAAIHPSELRPAGRIGSSSNTELSTASPATHEVNDYLGPWWRRAPPQSLGAMNLERPDAAITARGASSAYIAFGLPYPPRHATPSFNPNITQSKAAPTHLPTRPTYVTPPGYLGFGLPYEPRHESASFNPNSTHSNAATTNLRTTPTVSPDSPPPGWVASRPRCVSHYETPAYTTSITHPTMWRTTSSTPSGYIKPGATHGCSPEVHSFEANLKHRNTEPMNPWTKPVTSTPSNLAGREASRAAQTGASSVAGLSQVVTTVTHTPQRTMSASEIFKEVRECVLEYLGSDVER